MHAAALILILGRATVGQSASVPTFARDVAPIIYQKCAPCHHAGGLGPFTLTSFDEVRKHARQIVTVTRTRYMPPWLPAPQADAFADELRLTEEQIHRISAWVEAGLPAGSVADAPEPPVIREGWQLGLPDLIVKASQGVRVPASGQDIFWNFVLPTELRSSKFVRAVEVRPSNPKIVHHANIILDPTGSQRARERIPGAGFPGMEVIVPRNPLDLDGHFLFWKPGAIPWSEPDGFSWRLHPGSDLVLNMHLQPSGKLEWEQPSVGLYFTDRAPTHFPYLLQLENDETIRIPPGNADFVVNDSMKLPIDTQVLAIYPHAHFLGKLLEAWATQPDGKRVSLIRIPAWDPNWQAVYRFRNPVHLPADSVIHMRYHYDNSSNNPRNPYHPPRRVDTGNLATDEMGHLWLEVLPEHNADGRRVYAEAWAGHKLEKNANDFSANLMLGSLALSRLDAQDAVTPLAKAVRIRPADGIARNLYGSALQATGRFLEALEQFRSAVEQKPDYDNARFNLAHAEASTGNTKAAIENLRIILTKDPDDPAAKAYLDDLTNAPAR